MRLLTVEGMRKLEEIGNTAGYSYTSMMENAGKGIARVVDQRFNKTTGPILGLVGGGNNGGDTLLALAELQQMGWMTFVCLLKDRDEASRELNVYKKSGGHLVPLSELAGLSKSVRFSIILDGAIGTGFTPPISDPLNQSLIAVRMNIPSAKWVAVDCPSGTDCSSGTVSDGTAKADLTICLEAVKEGLLKSPAFAYTGELVVVDLGLEKYQVEGKSQALVVSTDDIRKLLPDRSQFSHKGSFGKTLVIGGSLQYCGAPILACKGAYSVGTGLVTAVVPSQVQSMMAGANPEITWFPLDTTTGESSDYLMKELLQVEIEYNSIVLGPGLGTGAFSARLISEALRGENPWQKENNAHVISNFPPFVIDADGLNLLAVNQDWEQKIRPGNVFTPHPGEMARLTGLSIDEIQLNRSDVAQEYSRRWEQTVVLKGPLTIVAEPAGKVTIIPIVTSALAKGGSGDVLAGMIGGYLAQGLLPAPASILATWVHGQAGVLAAREVGVEDSVLPFDIISAIPRVIQKIRE